MRRSMGTIWVLAVLLAPALASDADQRLSETLASLKTQKEAARAELANGQKPGAIEAEKKRAVERFQRSVGELGRRAVALADKHPGTSEAVEALVWAHSGAQNDPDLAGVVYDMLAARYLESEAILPLCRFAWLDAVRVTQAEHFLRAAIERSTNVKVRSLCCYSLAQHQQMLASTVRNLKDPARGAIVGKRLEHLGAVVNQRLRTLDADKLENDAADCFERTIKEFGDFRSLGPDFPPLRDQAAGMLFQMRHLGIGRTVPEMQGEDIDGNSMKLSEFRGKVILVSFWATWCGPCMGLVPDEKALVEKLRGRPFALIGVNGDEDRETAKAVSAKEGITWRSFWNGGPGHGIPIQWGVSSWPTIYLIDANGVIRANGVTLFEELDHGTPNKMIEALVAEAENVSKR